MAYGLPVGAASPWISAEEPYRARFGGKKRRGPWWARRPSRTRCASPDARELLLPERDRESGLGFLCRRDSGQPAERQASSARRAEIRTGLGARSGSEGRARLAGR